SLPLDVPRHAFGKLPCLERKFGKICFLQSFQTRPSKMTCKMRLEFAEKTFFKKKDKKCLFPAGFDKILANL
ncbi:hypothetical protein DN757_17330, partial [Paenibacillus silvae]